MRETPDPKHPATSAQPPATPAPAAYRPPAIAWEEPLEAIAAVTCLTFEGGGCDEVPLGG